MIAETIVSLIGGGLGGVLRLVPEVFKLLTDRADRAHELEMTRLQLEIDKARADQQIDLVHAQAAVAESQGQMTAWAEAIKGQSKKTGVLFIDGLSASVRPVITYWWLMLFTIAKGFNIYQAATNFTDMQTFVGSVWTDNDVGILSMILSFWFVDRVVRKNSGN